MYKKIDKSGIIYICETFCIGSKTSSRTVCKLGTISDLMEKNNWDEQQVLDWIDQKAKQMTMHKTLFDDIPQDNKNENIYYREKWHWNKNKKTEHFIITYSPKYAYNLQEKRKQQLERAEKMNNAGKRKGINDPARYVRET